MRSVTETLESIARDRAVLRQLPGEVRERFERAVASIQDTDPVARRLMLKAAERERRNRVDAALHETGIRALRRKPVLTSPNVFPPWSPQDEPAPDEENRAEEPQHCYVCKQHFSTIHHFYDQLCPPCAELNFQKRTELADLRGRVALLTGGRVKIGYQAGLKLLRSGAQLVVTTRFPRDSAQRYGREPDFAEWGHRLQIVGLDLRYPPGVEALCHHLLETLPAARFHR